MDVPMPKKHVNSFIGRLSPEKIAQGMNYARLNAIRLAEDAETLLNLDRFPSACALSILSIEESGKISILRGISIAKSDDEITRLWKDYRSHTKKNIMWLFPDLVIKGGRRLDDFKPIIDPSAEHPYLIDQIKQLSFYTDCLGTGHWLIPSEIIDKDLASHLVLTAKTLSKGSEITTKEIELWIKHLGGSAMTKEALLHWYYDMDIAGLLPPDHNMADLLKFLGFDSENISSD